MSQARVHGLSALQPTPSLGIESRKVTKMEVIGLTISIASLAGLFQTAVDRFQYVQFAKSFGADFQTSCLRWDNSYLRLTRWGATVGLGSSEAVTSLKDIAVSKQDIKRVEDLPGHIIDLFEQAETSSKKFAIATDANNTVSANDLLLSHSRALHKRMRNICLHRQGDRWAEES